jgi:hypothetical protein
MKKKDIGHFVPVNVFGGFANNNQRIVYLCLAHANEYVKYVFPFFDGTYKQNIMIGYKVFGEYFVFFCPIRRLPEYWIAALVNYVDFMRGYFKKFLQIAGGLLADGNNSIGMGGSIKAFFLVYSPVDKIVEVWIPHENEVVNGYYCGDVGMVHFHGNFVAKAVKQV